MKKNKKKKLDFQNINFDQIAKKAEEIQYKMKKEGTSLREACSVTPEIENDLYVLGKHFYDQGKNKEAGCIFQSLTLFSPNNFDYVYGLASAYHQTGDFVNAAVGFYRSFLLNPKNPLTMYYLSDCFIQLEDPVDALSFLDTTIAMVDSLHEERYQPIKERCILLQNNLRNKTPSNPEERKPI